ncbi:hypothetical protein D1BOALGB6SA_5346 [Olavius sp. associated proteobacterium Delta 1]|nr:hypothetical protein D1BOALGB6SA_5346 [Olavius sp. associated proteobacterium Delta 1]
MRYDKYIVNTIFLSIIIVSYLNNSFNKLIGLYGRSDYKKCGSGFQPRNQLSRIEAAPAS